MDKRVGARIFPPMPIPRRGNRLFAVILASLLLGSVVVPRLAAQDTTATRNLRPTPDSQVVKLTLRDGSVLVGRVIDVSPTIVLFASAAGNSAIPRSSIRKVEMSARRALHNGEFWPEDPSRTRLFFAPTGRMLRQGEGYFSDAYVFFPSFQGGLTNRFTLGAGASLLPGIDFDEQIYYLTPKLGIIAKPKLNVAIGALVAAASEFFDDSPFGIGYGVATYGGEDASVTAGVGFGFDRSSTTKAILMLGGSTRVSRSIALVTENYVYADDGANALISGGLRFMGEQIAVDLAGFTASDAGEFVPYVAFIYKF